MAAGKEEEDEKEGPFSKSEVRQCHHPLKKGEGSPPFHQKLRVLMALQDERSGWPLGLQPLSARLRLMEIANAGAFLAAATSASASPSNISSSLSPNAEKKKTMTETQTPPPQDSELLLRPSLEASSKSSTSSSSSLLEGIANTKRRRRAASASSSSEAMKAMAGTWCGFIGCANPLRVLSDTRSSMASCRCQVGGGTSLLQSRNISEEEEASSSSSSSSSSTAMAMENKGAVILEDSFRRNTLFAEDRILPPLPTGAPSWLPIEQASPASSYLSGDWSASVVLYEKRGAMTPSRPRRGGQSGIYDTGFTCPRACGLMQLA